MKQCSVAAHSNDKQKKLIKQISRACSRQIDVRGRENRGELNFAHVRACDLCKDTGVDFAAAVLKFAVIRTKNVVLLPQLLLILQITQVSRNNKNIFNQVFKCAPLISLPLLPSLYLWNAGLRCEKMIYPLLVRMTTWRHTELSGIKLKLLSAALNLRTRVYVKWFSFEADLLRRKCSAYIVSILIQINNFSNKNTHR